MLEAVGGRVGRSHSKSFRSRDGADDCQVAASAFPEIDESGIPHADKSLYIRVCCVQLHLHVQIRILETDARAKKKQIHAAHLVDEHIQFLACIFLGYVQRLNLNLIRCCPL